jgi:hypothetical protein
LHVTEHVWQPMHLSRFITIAICAMTLIGLAPHFDPVRVAGEPLRRR